MRYVGIPAHPLGTLPYPNEHVTTSAWDLEGIEGLAWAADAVDSGFASWKLGPLTQEGQQSLERRAREEARQADDAKLSRIESSACDM
jgi:hypothetical protein